MFPVEHISIDIDYSSTIAAGYVCHGEANHRLATAYHPARRCGAMPRDGTMGPIQAPPGEGRSPDGMGTYRGRGPNGSGSHLLPPIPDSCNGFPSVVPWRS